MKTTKRIISISLALIMTLTLGVSLITVAAVNAPLEQVANNKSLNLLAVQNVGSFGESVLANNPPLEVELDYNEELDKTLCKLTLKSNYGIDSAKITVVTTNRDQNDTLYNDTVFAGETFEFYTNRTENIVSIDCDDSVYVGSLLVYKGAKFDKDDSLYDLWMNKMIKTSPEINLSAYSNLSTTQSRQIASTATVNATNALLTNDTQIIYEESIADEAIFKFNVENGGYGLINFTSANNNAQYRLDVYYDIKYYDETMDDVLIQSFNIIGSENSMPIFLNGGHKYIKITRTNNISSAYSITINTMAWNVSNSTSNTRTSTLNSVLPLRGTPLEYNDSLWNTEYSGGFFNKNANCYAYALNIPVSEDLRQYLNNNYGQFSPESLWPGRMANYDSFEYLMSEEDLMNRFIADAERDDGDSYTGYLRFGRSAGLTAVPSGTYKIAIAYAVANDAVGSPHLYRQDNYIGESTQATWSHKVPGYPVRNVDGDATAIPDGDVIYNPYFCDRDVYTEFLCFAYVAYNP